MIYSFRGVRHQGSAGHATPASPADRAALMAKVGTIGDDVVKSKPELKPLWDLLRATTKRNLYPWRSI